MPQFRSMVLNAKELSVFWGQPLMDRYHSWKGFAETLAEQVSYPLKMTRNECRGTQDIRY